MSLAQLKQEPFQKLASPSEEESYSDQQEQELHEAPRFLSHTRVPRTDSSMNKNCAYFIICGLMVVMIGSVFLHDEPPAATPTPLTAVYPPPAAPGDPPRTAETSVDSGQQAERKRLQQLVARSKAEREEAVDLLRRSEAEKNELREKMSALEVEVEGKIKNTEQELLKLKIEVQREKLEIGQLRKSIEGKETSKDGAKKDEAKARSSGQRKIQATPVVPVSKPQPKPLPEKPKIDLTPLPANPKPIKLAPVPDAFNIPHTLWLFPLPNPTQFQKLQYLNNLHFAQLSNFTVHLVSQTTFTPHLSPPTASKLSALIKLLRTRVADRKEASNLRFHIDDIIRKMTLLFLVMEKGGVMISEYLAVTEDFDWIRRIKSNVHVNRGNAGASPQVVGFYSPPYSSTNKFEFKLNMGPKVESNMVLHPTLENYFVAARPKSDYLIQLVNELINILTYPGQTSKSFEDGTLAMRGLGGKDIYYEYFLIGAQKVVRDRQRKLDEEHRKELTRSFAVDYYGLFLINCYYAPYKWKIFWGEIHSSKAFQHMARYDLKEFEANVGPMRYVAFLTPTEEIGAEIERAQINARIDGAHIMKGSFIQRIFFPNGSESYILPNPEKPFVNSTAVVWDSLPKIIWVYWDTGLRGSGASNQICVQNLKRYSKPSGFKVIEVNDTNLKLYLDSEVIAQIETTIAKAKIKTFKQTRSDLIRLALLIKHGGIYMDASYILLENLDWLLNIGRYPSEYIFNRYGVLPKVFMLWHPHYGSPFQWAINANNGKVAWHNAYENNFIVAEKNSELIREWFELFKQLLMTPYEKTSAVLGDCGIGQHKWTNDKTQYLLAMDTIKCVIGRKQIALQLQGSNAKYKDASDYYRIWSMSGYLGQQKLRSNTNFQNPEKEDNFFVTRYSLEYFEGLMGKVRHLTKFYNHHSKEISQFIRKGLDANFSEIAHPKSIFMRYMYREEFKWEIIGNEAKMIYEEKGK